LLQQVELDKLLVLTDRISRMLTGLRKALEQRLKACRPLFPAPATHHPPPVITN